MFEAVNSISSRVSGNAPPPGQVLPLTTPGQKGEQKVPEEKVVSTTDQAAQAVQKAADEKYSEESQQVTEEMLDELERDIKTIHNIGLKFSKHDESGRTMIKVMDKQNEELIREIPSEDVLNLAAKIEEMIGILFDKKV